MPTRRALSAPRGEPDLNGGGGNGNDDEDVDRRRRNNEGNNGHGNNNNDRNNDHSGDRDINESNWFNKLSMNVSTAPQNQTINHRTILSNLEHKITRIQVEDLLPAGGGKPINFPKIHSIKKQIKDFPSLEWEDRRTILEFINEFIKYFGEYLTTDEQKIPVFVKIVRNSPALTALTDRIE